MNILLARVSPPLSHPVTVFAAADELDPFKSYICYQGRRQQSKPTGASLSRAGTRRGPTKPGQTLVSIPPPSAVQTAPAKAVFEPGSLLAARMM